MYNKLTILKRNLEIGMLNNANSNSLFPKLKRNNVGKTSYMTVDMIYYL